MADVVMYSVSYKDKEKFGQIHFGHNYIHFWRPTASVGSKILFLIQNAARTPKLDQKSRKRSRTGSRGPKRDQKSRKRSRTGSRGPKGGK
jgi:hypothetical protein